MNTLPNPRTVAQGAATLMGCVRPPGQNAVRCFVAGHPFDVDRDTGLVTDYTPLGGAYCHRCGFVPGVKVVRARQGRGVYPPRHFGVEYPPRYPDGAA